MDLRLAMTTLRARRWLVLTSVLVGAFLGVVLGAQGTPTYVARVDVEVSDVQDAASGNDTLLGADAFEQRMATFAHEATSEKVLQTAADSLGNVTAGELGGRVTASQQGTTQLLEIKATGDSAQEAIDTANAAAAALLSVKRDTQIAAIEQEIEAVAQQIAAIEVRIASLEAEAQTVAPTSPVATTITAQQNIAGADLAELQAQSETLSATRELQTGGGTVVNEATSGEAQQPPGLPYRLVGGMVLGLVVSFSMALVIDHLARRPQDQRSLEDAIPGLNVFGEIPTSRDLRDPSTMGEPIRRRFQRMANEVTLGQAPDAGLSLLVTSSRPREGKSTIANGLAMTFASGGRRTVLIPLDLGRSDLIEEPALVPDSERSFETNGTPPTLRTTNTVGLWTTDITEGDNRVSSNALAAVEKLRADGWTIVIDAPSLEQTSVVGYLASVVDTVVIVASTKATTDAEIRRVIGLVGRLGVGVGVVLNRAVI